MGFRWKWDCMFGYMKRKDNYYIGISILEMEHGREKREAQSRDFWMW